MSKSVYPKQRHSTKFPLTLHPTGQYCKKIRGKLYYFGADKEEAYKRYLEQATYLHSGKSIQQQKDLDQVSIKTLCNLYLENQEARVKIGELRLRQLRDQVRLLRMFAKSIGPNRAVADVTTLDLQNCKTCLIRQGFSGNTVNNHVAAWKAMFNWAAENEVLGSVPNLKAVKKVTVPKKLRQTFTPEEIKKMLDAASPQMRAMVLLGLNCGLGGTDCSELLWSNIDIENARIIYPRGKTGVDRNLPLWTETIEALRALPRGNKRVFNTKRGTPCVKTRMKIGKDGLPRYHTNDTIGREFAKLLKDAHVEAEKGTGFYSLRRTAATFAARFKDPFAVQRLLGHADLKMATTYVQDVSEQTDSVINQTRKIIIPGNS